MNQLTVSFWGDEAFAAILAQKNILEIIQISINDTSPPLSYLLLHTWTQIFGTSELGFRSFSLVLVLLLALGLFFLTRELFGKKAGFLAAVLTLLNPFLFTYAFETRMYMLLVTTSALSMLFFVKKKWIFYVLATLAALYTHHFALFIVLVQVVWFYSGLLLASKFNLTVFMRSFWQETYTRVLLAVFFFYAFWFPALYWQTTRVGADFWLPRPETKDLLLLFQNFTAGVPEHVFKPPLLYLAGIILLIRKWDFKKDSLLVAWLVLPALLTFLVSQVKQPIFFDRYLIVSVPALVLLLASNWRRFGLVPLGLLMVGLVFINFNIFTHPQKQPFREVANYILKNWPKEEIVVNYYTNALHLYELKYYKVNVQVYSPSGPLPFWTGTALLEAGDVLDKLPENKEILIMASGEIERIKLPGYQLTQKKNFENLYLLWFEKI